MRSPLPVQFFLLLLLVALLCLLCGYLIAAAEQTEGSALFPLPNTRGRDQLLHDRLRSYQLCVTVAPSRTIPFSQSGVAVARSDTAS